MLSSSGQVAMQLDPAPQSGAALAGAKLTTETIITFGIGSALYALPVTPVLEILDTRDIAPLPRAPAHLLGLIDRRGVSVPVVDMRLLLGLETLQSTDETRILVLRVALEGEDTGVLGLRVDRVIEVTVLDDARSDDLPEADLLDWNARMVSGIGRREGAFVTVLDIDYLFDRTTLNHSSPLTRLA